MQDEKRTNDELDAILKDIMGDAVSFSEKETTAQPVTTASSAAYVSFEDDDDGIQITEDMGATRIIEKPADDSAVVSEDGATRMIDAVEATRMIFDRIADETLLMRRFTVAVCNLKTADEVREAQAAPEQLDLFTDYEAQETERRAEDAALAKETRRQKALLDIRDKYGKNAVVRGLNLQEGATAIERNAQIGGHKA